MKKGSEENLLISNSDAKTRKIVHALYLNKADELLDERTLQGRSVVILPSVNDWKSTRMIPEAGANGNHFNMCWARG